ncbi:glycoside hydrolase superfamily [Dipodascopsis uninucleata]
MATFDIEETLRQLTLNEKVSLLSGTDFWHTASIPKHGIPAIRMTDGPNGVRGTRFFNSIPAACFPCGTALGATWDQVLLEKAGWTMGEEAKAKGAHVILGPTINMQRSPLGGRGFESISEDPVLAGAIASSIVNGIQSTKVAATIKHYVCNDQEDERNAVSSVITQRALREIYLLPFQIVMRDSAPLAFMTGYNKVNGVHCSSNKFLIDDVLRKEWGFDGLVMSDWIGTYSVDQSLNAGLDLEMPGPTIFRGNLAISAVMSRLVSDATLDERVRNVLKLINRVAATGVKENASESGRNIPETAELLRKITGDSIVLLKNEDKVLPLRKSKATAVIGPNAKIAAFCGGGSASLRPYYAVTPFDAISEKLDVEPKYSLGCAAYKSLPVLGSAAKIPNGKPGLLFKVYLEPPTIPERRVVDEIELANCDMLLIDYKIPNIEKPEVFYGDIITTVTVQESGLYEFGVTVYGSAKLYVDNELVVDNATAQRLGKSFFGKGTVEETGKIHLESGRLYNIKIQFGSAKTCKLGSRTVSFAGGGLRVGFTMSTDPQAELEKAVSIAKSVDQVVLCIGLSSEWESEGYDRADMKLPFDTDKLVEAILRANPNTVIVNQSGTPVEMPWTNKAKALLQAWYGGNETGNGIADVIFGDVNPSGKLPLSFPIKLSDNPAYLNYRSEAGRVLYGEDVYVGYRYYEKTECDVLFPFGYGLSYSTFEFSDLAVLANDITVNVTVTVQNISGIHGAEVIQVYISQKNPKIWRPAKELKGFSKVFLNAGESKTITIPIDLKYATSYYDEINDKWISEKDVYTALVGRSSQDILLEASFDTKQTFWWKGI